MHLVFAGSLKVLCAWMMILLPSLDAAHVPKKPAAVVSCRLKELTTLTKSLVEASKTSFVSSTMQCISVVCLVVCVTRP